MIQRFRPGEPAWIELCTTDPAGAEEFYGALLGWTCRHERLGGGTYRMCHLDGQDVAGIADASLLHGGAPLGWITYFATDDVTEAVARAVSLGGDLISPPRYLPDAGTGATVVDPLGATFGLYEGESRAGVERLNSAGSLCWNELATGDPAASVTYYQSLFDYQTERRSSSTGSPYTMLTLDSKPVAGVLELDNEWPNVLPARWVPYLSVDDIHGAAARVVELGGSTSLGPVESPNGTLYVVRDPEGNALSLIALEAELREDAHLSASATTNPGA